MEPFRIDFDIPIKIENDIFVTEVTEDLIQLWERDYILLSRRKFFLPICHKIRNFIDKKNESSILMEIDKTYLMALGPCVNILIYNINYEQHERKKEELNWHVRLLLKLIERYGLIVALYINTYDGMWMLEYSYTNDPHLTKNIIEKCNFIIMSAIPTSSFESRINLFLKNDNFKLDYFDGDEENFAEQYFEYSRLKKRLSSDRKLSDLEISIIKNSRQIFNKDKLEIDQGNFLKLQRDEFEKLLSMYCLKFSVDPSKFLP